MRDFGIAVVSHLLTAPTFVICRLPLPGPSLSQSQAGKTVMPRAAYWNRMKLAQIGLNKMWCQGSTSSGTRAGGKKLGTCWAQNPGLRRRWRRLSMSRRMRLRGVLITRCAVYRSSDRRNLFILSWKKLCYMNRFIIIDHCIMLFNMLQYDAICV